MQHYADMSILDLPIALRISDKKIKYLSSLVIDAGKEPGERNKRKCKVYRAYNNITEEVIIGTSKEIAEEIYSHMTHASQLGMVNGLYKGKYKNKEGWTVGD